VLIQRRNGAGKTFTVRRQASDSLRRADWQWLLAWETAAASERLAGAVLDSPLHASRRTEFEVLHGLTGDGWTPKSYRLSIDQPFRMNCQAEPWAAHLVSQCDGTLTGRRHFERFKEAGVIPPQATEAEFADAVAPLISGGFVEVDGFRPPQAAV
jgi:hypothetical protein